MNISIDSSEAFVKLNISFNIISVDTYIGGNISTL